ncbi:M28 family peptidase [Fulvivirga maritima]|uniref:M28 family peptidase n=1 Tax=Fulvivirga maritima TaxID=2904247 RepID=UPI001F39413B|nr:M28 family peptidase [Fulvivirga maritima]UII28651.1 M28 family peptidase [Fulvivirga maritima]
MDASLINTFAAYGGAVGQRVAGASEAAKLGAVAVVVRSMASNNDDIPHTGTLHYEEGVKAIPAVAISTNSADLLSKAVADDASLKLYVETHCKTLPDVLSYNVIGEMYGSGNTDEYIVVGGHLDSWDLGDGSHDDGAGCVQSIEVLRILKGLKYTPQKNIRAVMYMNEENGLRGGLKYAELASFNKEKHIAAIESDRGGFTPKGFTISGSEAARTSLMSWKHLFEPYTIYDFGKEGGGADIGPLKDQGTALIGFLPDSQRYFNYHHTGIDTFDKIDKRELELGAASMAALVYLIDKYGIDGNP